MARRIAVKRDEGRRRLRRLAWIGGIAVALAAAALVTRTPLLDIDRVEVVGAERASLEEVLSLAAEAGGARGEALLDVREAAVARAVESLPVVADADVQRRWPNALRITIVERAPVAAIVIGEAVAEVAADGVIVGVAVGGEVPPGVPVLLDVSADPRPGALVDARALLSVAAAMPPALAAHIEAIGAGDGSRTVELHLTDGATVRLGPADDLTAKLTAVTTVLDQLDPACLAVLDVRVPVAPAVTPRTGSSCRP